MADQKLIIQIGERQVLSELEHEEKGGGSHQVIWVTSTCEGRTQRNSFAPHPTPSYTREQLEYDLDQFRHEMASRIAGEAHLRSLVPGAILRSENNPIRVVDSPEHPRP